MGTGNNDIARSFGEAEDSVRTLTFGDIAMERLRSHGHPAFPRYYEFWYSYATNYNPTFNEAVDQILERGGMITTREVDVLYDLHLSAARQSVRYDEVGIQMRGEIEQIMTLVDAARGTADAYGESLGGVQDSLSKVSREQMRVIVEHLIRATREMQFVNKELEEKLTDSHHQMVQLQEKLEAIRAEALTDPLTLLANRKYFDTTLANQVESGKTFSLLVSDIDHFKKFNDSYGHLVGDQVLRLVALAVKQNVKGLDIAARYGGEEFAIILPNTGLRPALTVAEHIRRAVMTKELVKRSTGESLGRVTLSIGVATFHKGDTPQSLLQRADICLYAAKRTGRNRVVCESDSEANRTSAVA